MADTDRIGLTLVVSTDHLVGTSVADGMMFKVNDAFETLDDLIGAVVCTSTTRPSSPYGGQILYETDTRNVVIRNLANNAWVTVNTGIPVVATTSAVTSPFTHQVVYDISFACLRKYNGTSWDIFNPNTQTKFKSTTTSRSSTTTMGNDPDFSFTMLANSAYKIDGYVVAKGPAVADLNCDINLPAGASVLWTNFANVGPDAGDTGLTNYNVVPQGVAAARGINLIDTVNMISFPLRGTAVIGATAGTLNFRWAQKVGNAGAVEILGGSWMEVTRIV